MKFIELFDSRDKKKRLSHIKNLLAIAMADGVLEDSELELIFRIGVRAGISEQEIQRLITRPRSVGFYPPESYKDKIEQLYDMVLVMMVDGEISENEINLCKILALKLGFKSKVIDLIVGKIINEIEVGIATDIAIHNLIKKLELI